MTTVKLGTNDFFGVPFPLVLADRFFHIYTGADGRMLIDVFRWDPDARTAVYEVEASRPQANNITTNPTGIVSFSAAPDGGFLFKFRPKPGVSEIFGKIPVTDEIEVHIRDQEIVVTRNNTPMVTFKNNSMSGIPIGIRVGADSSVGYGSSTLPDGMAIARRSGL